MSNTVRVYVENSDEVLATNHSGAGAVVQIQSATTEDGAFGDIGTVAVVSQVRAYSFADAAGDESTWYRYRFETSGGVSTSSWLAPFQVGKVGYCDLNDVKQRLDRLTGTADDELFAEYIDEATDYINGHIGRSLIDTGTVYTFDGYSATHGGTCLLVPRGVRSLSLVETSATTGGSFTTVTSTDYLLRPTTQDRSPGWPATELWLVDNATSLHTFPRGYANVRLTGTFGFSPIPRRIEEVALNLVVRMYASRQAGQNDMLGAGGDGGQPMVSSFLSRRDRETLDKFTPMLAA